MENFLKRKDEDKITKMLDNKNISLEDLLATEGCVSELNRSNVKLLEFFDHTQICNLVDFITLVPLADDTFQ